MDDHVMNKIAYQCWVEMDDFNSCCGCIHRLDEQSFLFYVLRDKNNKYYTNGSRSYPNGHWISKIDDARIYVNLGQARAQVTRLGKDLDIVEFKAEEIRVLDEKAHFEKLNKAKASAAEKLLVRQKADALLEAKEVFEKARLNLEKLTTGVNSARCSECGHEMHSGWSCPAESFNGYACRCKFR